MQLSYFLLVVPAAACTGGSGQPQRIANPESGKCLEVYNPDGLAPSQYTDGTQVNIYRCNKAEGQKWMLQDGQLINTPTGKCLTIETMGNLTAEEYQDESKVQLVQCNRNDNQQWALVDQGPDRKHIVNLPSGKCLDIYSPAGYLEDDTAVQLFTCDATKPNQQWTFEDLEEDQVPMPSQNVTDDQVLKAIAAMKAFVKSKDNKPSAVEFHMELRTMQATFAFDPKIQLFISVSTLLSNKLNEQELLLWKEHINEVIIKGDPQDGALAGSEVLWAFDAYVEANPSIDDNDFSTVLKAVYENKWCTKETMLMYFTRNQGEGQPGFTVAKQKAAVFLKWLKETVGLQYDDPKVRKISKEMKVFVSTKNGKPSSVEFHAELVVKQTTFVFDDKIKLFIALSTLCGGKLNQMKLIQWKDHLNEIITNGSNGALAGSEVLWVFDAYIEVHSRTANVFPLALQMLLEQKWCSEEDVLAYYKLNQGKGEPGFSLAQDKVVPFFDWITDGSEPHGNRPRPDNADRETPGQDKPHLDHIGDDCFAACDGVTGKCPTDFCGTEGWCCRFGVEWDVNGCFDVGCHGKHCCTQQGNSRDAASMMV